MEPRVVAAFWHYAVLLWVAGYVVLYLFPLAAAP
jgi:hypothetical protein